MRISLRKPSAGSACELAKSPLRLLRLGDGNEDGCAGATEDVRGVKRVGGGLRGRDGNASPSNGADIRGNNHIRSAAYHPGQSDLGAGLNGIRGRCEGRDLRGGSAGNGVLRVQRWAAVLARQAKAQILSRISPPARNLRFRTLKEAGFPDLDFPVRLSLSEHRISERNSMLR